ncbi:DUF4129 domain-containing protein [Urbifossiella limnaea]|uniref:Protein-glutamine gamma-glutamyltransferase-like C-terminal domain-containing protein n=1 Tax=Urbifossiella limnaea TaxID=2528023 RepID=A0A517XSB3_9BACT|nr:DUF4129 domain-containing protein [Urbifossiella limnaea]QDU20397.1 hypothetical protein ETAA1_23490 [Urbifossiella limnaea]
MAADRDPPTAADYAVTAASPALVMLMVGSLVFFLVEVLYAGLYSERLLYTLFFFVFGAVLVARIAIQYDAARATVYGLGLGGVTFLALMAYVEYPAGTPFQSVRWLVNLGLMLLIWWSAHKLTWDCTHIDENRDSSGRGLLSAAGFGDEPAEDEPPAPEPAGKKKKKRGHGAFAGWVNGWRATLAARRNRPHTPGVWVIYFALAALPLFAIGQSLIPPDDADRRRATFLQMAVYVGSALGLLVTTSLLGLRRYLRQRKAKPPAALTAGWLGLGAGLIVVFLALGAFLPRPHAEVPWFGLPRAGTSEREASQYAQLGDSAGKGDGAEGNVSEKGAGNAAGKGGEPGGGKGEKGAGGNGDDGNSGGGKDGKGAGKSQAGSKGEARGKSDGAKGKDDGSGGKVERDGGESRGKSGRRTSGGGSPPQVSESVQKVAEIAKWIVLVIVAFLVLAGVVLAVLKYLAPFTGWAQRWLDAVRAWWVGLFGKTEAGRSAAADEEEHGPLRPPPFSAFTDPFAGGSAVGRDPAELVEYTFAALDSWAWDRDHGRRADETPLEFAARLADEFPDHGPDYRRLAGAYARVAYATGSPPAGTLKLLEAVWDRMVHGTSAAAAVD